MKKITKQILICVSLVTMLISCKDEGRILSESSGKAGEVIVVANANIWNGMAGDTLRKILTEPDTLLPQPEPKFSLINVPESGFSGIFRIHRNVVFMLTDTTKTSCEIFVKTDKYSQPQTLVYIIGPNQETMVNELCKKGARVSEIFEKAELDRIEKTVKIFENPELREMVEKKYNYSVYFPQDYDLLGDKNNFMWIGIKTTKRTQGIFIYSYPYTSKEQLTLKSLIEKRNEILKEYVLMDKEPQGSAYMTTANYVTPKYKTAKINGNFYAIIRGLWEVENDFMGGPFVSYTTVDTAKNVIVTFDGFVYAPSKTKRDLIRQIEGIILTNRPLGKSITNGVK